MFGLLVVVGLVGVGAYFYPSYASSLPISVPMDGTEAHIMAVYLVAIGLVFTVVSLPRRQRISVAQRDSKAVPAVAAAAAPPTGTPGEANAQPITPPPPQSS